MRVRRDISSIPHRSASETWQRIIDLVSASGSKDVDQLEAAAAVVASIITDEHPAAHAIVLEGCGPQLRLYCRYGMKAVEEGSDVDVLSWNPTDGDWTMRVPCDAENISWVRSSLAKSSPRLKVFDVADPHQDEDEDDSGSAAATARSGELKVDWNIRG